MSRIYIILVLLLLLIFSTSSTIIINIKTKNKIHISQFKLYENITITINNKTIDLNSISSNGFDFQSDYGEVEIIIKSNLTNLKSMFNLANVYCCENAFQSIKIKSLNAYVTDVSDLFHYQRGLTFVDLSEFDISKVTNFNGMFQRCYNLVSIKFGNYMVYNPINMANMFSECYMLNSLDLNNFNISSVIDMRSMFYECRLLTSLNISNFKETNVLNTTEMFSGCLSLTSLDLKNFKPTQITKMNKMFYSCVNLKSLDLGNFDTSLTTNMESMFSECQSLIYLNINNFNTTLVSNMANMFKDCSSLTSLNLSSFKISNNTNMEDILHGISENLIYCINDDFYQKIETFVSSKTCAFRDNNCITGWHMRSKKIIKENDYVICYENCSETINYKYEYENKCYSSCPIGTTSLYNNNFLCEIFNEKEIKENINKDNSDDINNINTNTNIIRKEFKTDNIINNNLPQICNPNDFFNHECSPIKFNSMVDLIINQLNDGLMNNIIDDVIKNEIDFFNMDNNIKYQITSTHNQKNKIYDNISVIDLKECENKLKDIYDIPKNASLIIFKYDYISNEALIPIVGYEVFNPITKEKLNLNHCKNIKININLPVNISEDELYKHNPQSDYYKDKCSSYHNEKGVDMTLYDRKKEYNDKNLALCAENCEYINYNNETKKVLCQCEPMFNSSLLTLDKIINKKKLLNNFIDIKKSINIDVIKCFKKFMSPEGIKNNIGSYIILSIILIYIIGLILFLMKGYKLLFSKIEKIMAKYNEQNKSKSIIVDNPPKSNYIKLNTLKKLEKKRKLKIRQILII